MNNFIDSFLLKLSHHAQHFFPLEEMKGHQPMCNAACSHYILCVPLLIAVIIFTEMPPAMNKILQIEYVLDASC